MSIGFPVVWGANLCKKVQSHTVQPGEICASLPRAKRTQGPASAWPRVCAFPKPAYCMPSTSPASRIWIIYTRKRGEETGGERKRERNSIHNLRSQGNPLKNFPPNPPLLGRKKGGEKRRHANKSIPARLSATKRVAWVWQNYLGALQTRNSRGKA